jgi:hypothetical protein
MRLVLLLNIFEFETKLFQELLSTAMGTLSSPTFANIFLAKVDKKTFRNGWKQNLAVQKVH